MLLDLLDRSLCQIVGLAIVGLVMLAMPLVRRRCRNKDLKAAEHPVHNDGAAKATMRPADPIAPLSEDVSQSNDEASDVKQGHACPVPLLAAPSIAPPIATPNMVVLFEDRDDAPPPTVHRLRRPGNRIELPVALTRMQLELPTPPRLRRPSRQ